MQRTLTKSELEASAERLSAPKAIVEASTVRPKALQLKYKFDKSLRGGKGGYTEVLVPAKKTAAADKQVRLPTVAPARWKGCHAGRDERAVQGLHASSGLQVS